MEKSLEQLKQEYEKTTVLLEREKRKMQRLKNRQAYLESGSRKQRTHRLITRGAAVESIAPQTKDNVWNSLNQLRTGPFGAGRHDAKEKIIEQMEDWKVKNSAC